MSQNHVVISCSQHTIVIRLEYERAPATCANFVGYIEAGLLRDSSLYRVTGPRNQGGQPVPVEAVQGGMLYRAGSVYDPTAGLGPIIHESTALTGLRHLEGTVSMSRYGPGETYGSFFVCVGPQPELDFGGRRFPDGQGAAAFGTVVEGMELFHSLCRAAEPSEFLRKPIPIDRMAVSVRL